MTTLEASAIQLRFVPLDRLLVHEETDPFRVKRLAHAFARDGKLRNPPVVTKRGDRYVVLDGATRTGVMRQMGLRHALVQIVDNEADTVDLRTWHHVVVGLPPLRLLSNLAEVHELALHPVKTESAHRMLEERQIVARIIMCDGREFGVLCQGDIICLTDKLCQLVAVYRGKAQVHRTTSTDLPALLSQYPDLAAVIAFPRFRPAEIVHIALEGSRVPMGVTRHIISGRAIGLDISLKNLTATSSLEEKNAWLDDLIRQRLQANKIRLYEEPVFVFDD